MDPAVWKIFEIYGLAILLGALMGFERERKQSRLAGLRTFILITLFGAICGQIGTVVESTWIVFAGLLAILVQSGMVHFLRVKEAITAGMTTSIALLVAYGIGVLVALEQILAAVTLALATTVILYFKPQLHQFTKNLSEKDIHAIFQFGLIAFIILPVLPNQGYGPYNALNPYNIWLMVVMISAINLVGYVILKIVGQRWGGPVLGILGGIVSSTATTLSFSRHAKNNPGFSLMGAVVVSLASAVVLIRMAVLVGIIHAQLLTKLVLPLSAMFCVGLAAVIIVWKRTDTQETPTFETNNPMELRQALLFGMIYAVVLLGVSAGEYFFGNKGVYLVSLISGLTDVDAITLSNARIASKGALASDQAAISILIAYVSNLFFKLAVVGILGTRKMLYWLLITFASLGFPALLVLM
jgi:uncharacterized membrane protein (DUF4010 family)